MVSENFCKTQELLVQQFQKNLNNLQSQENQDLFSNQIKQNINNISETCNMLNSIIQNSLSELLDLQSTKSTQAKQSK